MMNKLIFGCFVILSLAACSAEKGKKENVDPKQLISDLFLAVLENDVASVKELVNNPNTDLMAYDEQGFTALMRATQEGRSPYIIETLINGGAKIYQPSLNDKGHSAFNNIDQKNTEIIKIFEKEKNRLAVELEGLIEDQDFSLVRSFTKDNSLPFDLVLPKSKMLPLELALKSLSSNDTEAIDYLKYLISEYKNKDRDLGVFVDDVNLLATRIRNVEFLDYYLKSLNQKDVLIKLVDEDFKNLSWLTSKINIINENTFKTNIQDKTQNLVDALISLKDSNLENKFLLLHSSIQKSLSSDYVKSAILQDVLKSLEMSLNKHQDQILWIPNLIDVWKANRKSFESTGYSFDEHTLLILKNLKGNQIDLNEVDHIFTKISLFAPSYENRSEESLKYLISTNAFEFSVKKTLVEMLLKRSQALPDDIISYTVQHGGVPELDLLLDSKVQFDPRSQALSVLTVLKATKSGDMAYSFLIVLNENDIPFDTEYGKQALRHSLNKMWEENDATYRGVYDYLVSLRNSPITVMSDDEVIDSLKLILGYAKDGRAEWKQLTQFIDKIKNPILNSKSYIKDDVYFENKDVRYSLNVSFLWDFIMEAYEIVTQKPHELDTMLVIVRKLAEKFPEEEFSFSFYGENFITFPEANLSQNVIFLSALFTLSKDEINNALKIQPEVFYSKSLSTTADVFSWDKFITGQVFEYYSKEPKFWESLLDTLFRSGRSFTFEASKQHILFSKILLHSEKASRFPILKDGIKKTKMSYYNSDMICVLDKEEYETHFLEKDKSPSWVSLGSFEVLDYLKSQSCKFGYNLTSDDVEFIRHFVSNNLEDYKEFNRSQRFDYFGMTKRDEGFCSSIFGINQSNYLFDWDQSGTAIKAPKNLESLYGTQELLGFSADQRCYSFEYDFYAAYKAKTQFLSQWFECAVNNNDNPLIRFFESLNKNHHVTPTSENKGLHTCRW